jgi:hypothetical protein
MYVSESPASGLGPAANFAAAGGGLLAVALALLPWQFEF